MTTYYHGSPNTTLTNLRAGSWVTRYKYVAEIMGRYHIATGKTWTDLDLFVPYSFTKKIRFKAGRKPTGKPAVYRLEATSDEIDLLGRRHEHITKVELPVVRVK